jgi:hypothetical protein
VGPTETPSASMGVPSGGYAPLAELVVFLFVARALGCPAREERRFSLVRMFLGLEYSQRHGDEVARC